MGIDGVKGIGDMKIAEIRNLSYSYRENCGQKKAVLNVSFDIDEGECLGLIGESGSGKSTIGSLIGNFLTGYEGSIHLMSNEKELADMSKKERHDLYRDIQVVFQNPWQSFPPNMCVGEGIAEGIRYYSRGLASEEKVKREGVGDHASCGTIRILLSKEMQRAEWWRVPEGSYWACDYSITEATYLR